MTEDPDKTFEYITGQVRQRATLPAAAGATIPASIVLEPPPEGWRLAEALRSGHTEVRWQVHAAAMHARSMMGPAEAREVARARAFLWTESIIPRCLAGELVITGIQDGTTARVTIELSWVRHAHVDYERNILRLGSIQYVGVQIMRPITKVVRNVRPDQQTVNVWMLALYQSARDAGQPTPLRGNAFFECAGKTGAADKQMRQAMKNVPECLKRRKGDRNRQIG